MPPSERSWFDSPGESAAATKKRGKKGELKEVSCSYKRPSERPVISAATAIDAPFNDREERYLQRTDFTAFRTYRGVVAREGGRRVIFQRVSEKNCGSLIRGRVIKEERAYVRIPFGEVP